MTTRIHQPRRYLDYYDPEPLVERNPFRSATPDLRSPPRYAEVRDLLPEPSWDGNQSAIRCYHRCWELAFGNLRGASPQSGFVSPFIDTAFNDCLFMWDSALIVLFGRYGARAFDFQRTLDNFYALQHPDGFICREIQQSDGQDRFHRHDPVSTGPHLLPWAEWEHWVNLGDRQRIERVFAPLLAYHRWLERERSWPAGGFWSCGLASGMDNQPRVIERPDSQLHHGHMAWIDACSQMVLSARQLASMARLIGQPRQAATLDRQAEALAGWINERMWNERTGFYGDRLADGGVSDVRTIGAYWTLLADVAPRERIGPMLDALEDPALFGRPHPVPSLAADHPAYRPEGGYWRGGVWPPTNYMVLRGLCLVGHDGLAHRLALRHLQRVVQVFEQTGTVWENYAPETPSPGRPAKADFVGWSGLGPIAVLLENVFGLRPDVPAGRLLWDLRLTDAHGVRRYPFGSDGLVDLQVEARRSASDDPVVQVESTVPLVVQLRWPGGERQLQVGSAA